MKEYQKDLDIPHGVALDIIPLDGYAPTKWKRKWQCMHALFYSLFCAQTIPKKHGGLMVLGSKMLLFIFRGKKIRYRIYSRAKRKMTRYKIADCQYITELCSGPYYMKKKYKSEWFKEAKWVEFEGRQMPIPIGYDGYLKEAFGDYLTFPDEEKRKPPHDYLYLDLENGYEKYKGLKYMVK